MICALLAVVSALAHAAGSYSIEERLPQRWWPLTDTEARLMSVFSKCADRDTEPLAKHDRCRIEHIRMREMDRLLADQAVQLREALVKNANWASTAVVCNVSLDWYEPYEFCRRDRARLEERVIELGRVVADTNTPYAGPATYRDLLAKYSVLLTQHAALSHDNATCHTRLRGADVELRECDLSVVQKREELDTFEILFHDEMELLVLLRLEIASLLAEKEAVLDALARVARLAGDAAFAEPLEKPETLSDVEWHLTVIDGSIVSMRRTKINMEATSMEFSVRLAIIVIILTIGGMKMLETRDPEPDVLAIPNPSGRPVPDAEPDVEEDDQ